MIKKGDIIVFAVIILSAVLIAVGLFSFRKNGSELVITVNNEEYGRYPLSEDRVIPLEHNTAVIKDGFAYMESADCPDKVCVNSPKISKRNETVICLPNKVLLKVE